MERILLHTCCAPCSIHCVESLRGEGIEPVSFWYNPNIHPFQEYKARRDTLKGYAASIGMELILADDYGLFPFTEAVAGDLGRRCGRCYAMRLEETARAAAALGYAAFSTTLLVSPYQQHDLLRAEGEAAGEKFGVSFLYRDFRPGFRSGQQRARELGLYMQKYCGCVFSEAERYGREIARDRAASRWQAAASAGEAE